MIKKITFDTYPIVLHVFISETDSAIQEYVDKNQLEFYEPLLELDETEEAIFVYATDYPHIYLRFRVPPTIDTLVHEAFHATVFIMRHTGIRLSKNSEEAYAYLLEYITENIND